MSIRDRLDEDLKSALRGHDQVTRDTVRLAKAAIQNAEIEKRAPLDEAGVTDALARMVRQYRESIAIFREHGREDAAVREEAELAVVMRYLPQQLDREEVVALAREAAAEVGATGPTDRGKVMGKLMPQLRGKADGAVVNAVVGELLESLAQPSA